MKRLLFLVVNLAFSFTIYAQTNGINYKALIKDGNGNVVANQTITIQFSILKGVAQTNVYQETQTPTTDTNGIVIVNIGEGTTSDDFYTIDWSSDDHFLNVQINTGAGLIDLGTSQFMAVPYALSAANVTGLETIDEGNGIGYRIKGRDPANYDTIGLGSMDLSLSYAPSVIYGASGIYATAMGVNTIASGNGSSAMGVNTAAAGEASTAMGTNTRALGIYDTAIGYNTEASGSYSLAMGRSTTASGQEATAIGLSTIASGGASTAMGTETTASGKFSTAIGYGTNADTYSSTAFGKYNIGGGDAISWVETDPLVEIGNGSSDSNRSNALTILKNGTITAPSFDLAEITDDKALITKEYADTNLTASGLEAIDEGNGIGYRIKDRNPENYGNIGLNAVDLSYSVTASEVFGASGVASTAFGINTTASGGNSTALGNTTIASGTFSTAMGYLTDASGNLSIATGFDTEASGTNSTAMGRDTEASGFVSTAIGRFNIGGGNPTTWVETDPLVEIGNGANDANRSNALTILKNGTITAPSFDLAEITDDKALITKEYADANLSSSGLEAIDEGNGIGYRLKATDPANYGDIGFNATDVSYHDSTSSVYGATGEYSTALGYYTSASGSTSLALGVSTNATGIGSMSAGFYTDAEAYGATALGRFNIGGGNANSWNDADPLFEIGNGITNLDRSNVLTILKNGTITAPSFDLAEITDDKALITKEYADTNLGGSGLEDIDEGNGIGWRLKSRDPANYGKIGENAVDLSYGQSASTTRGASGKNSIAMGYGTTASGYFSTAMGQITTASGNSSIAMGSFTTASGSASIAMGSHTTASGRLSIALGRYNIGGGDTTSWVETDPLFEIGNGTDDTNRNNAITVLKNGKVGIGNHQPAGFLEVKAANTGSQPNLNLINEGVNGARINFSNTDTTNGNAWTLYGNSNDTNANSSFNIFHPNAPSNGNILQIKGDGKVGINGTPTSEFEVYHDANAGSAGFKISNTGANANFWRMYVNNATGRLLLFSKAQGTTSVGDFNEATGVYSSTSDRRLKKDFKPLPFSWQNFMKLETLSYLYKAQKDTKRSLGLIAQDVELIYPELVSYSTEDDVYHMNYSGFGVIAIKAVQEQQKIIQSQQLRIEALEAKLTEKDEAYNALSSRIETIETFLKTSEK